MPTPRTGRILVVALLGTTAVVLTLWMGGTLRPTKAASEQRTDGDTVADCLRNRGTEPTTDEFGNIGIAELTPDAEACLQRATASPSRHVPLSAADEAAVYAIYSDTIDQCMAATGYPVTWMDEGGVRSWAVDESLYGTAGFQRAAVGCQREAIEAESAEREARR